jgi:hypothetical protein
MYDCKCVTNRRKQKTETERNVQVQKILGLRELTTAIAHNKTYITLIYHFRNYMNKFFSSFAKVRKSALGSDHVI